MFVQKLGHSIDTVQNGQEAVEAVIDREYEVVLMDVQMPTMDGLEATRRIIRHFGELDRPYIIGLTASADRSECLGAGMDSYLQKPVRSEELADLLAEAIVTASEWRRERSLRNGD